MYICRQVSKCMHMQVVGRGLRHNGGKEVLRGKRKPRDTGMEGKTKPALSNENTLTTGDGLSLLRYACTYRSCCSPSPSPKCDEYTNLYRSLIVLDLL